MTKLTNDSRGWRAAAGVAAALAVLLWGGAYALAEGNAADKPADKPAAGPAQKAEAKPGVEADWPCPQKYVAEMSWGAIWTGPSLDEVSKEGSSNPKLWDTVTLLSDDTTSEAEAITAINAYADSVEGDKKKEMTALFAKVYETMNNQRTSANAGIKRFYQRQQKVADRVNAAGAVLRKLDDKKVKHDAQEYLDAQTTLAWTSNVFDERQKLVPYMCDVPVIIERRLGTFAHAIMAQIEGEPMTPPAETAKP